MQTEKIQNTELPTKSTFNFVARGDLLILENETTRLVFGSFADMLDLQLAISEALTKAQNYGLLKFEEGGVTNEP